jgi:hypothetical protein
VIGMLGGQVAIFLSCSEKFKQAVAWPVRVVLGEHGMRGIIVGDEPALPGTGDDHEARVGAYLDASSAFVALCTPDYGLSDGTSYPRASIIEEIQRAVSRPRLRDRCQVLKAPGVQLPSSITPTFDALDVSRPVAAAEIIVQQLASWGELPGQAGQSAAAPGAGGGVSDLDALLAGLRPDDQDAARRRAYGLLRGRDTAGRREIADVLCQAVLADAEHPGNGAVGPAATPARLESAAARPAGEGRPAAAAALLQAVGRLDALLVPAEMIETLATCTGYLPRSCAANLLHDRAVVAPLDVPVEVLGQLVLPGAEDWYVWSPALAAAKELVLTRREAYVIFESLSDSPAAQDRHAVAQALLDIAGIRPDAVAAELAQRLQGDADPLVAAKAGEVVALIGRASNAGAGNGYGHFARGPIT